jgi:hypothetical protein
VDWINLAHDLDKWWVFVYSVIEICVPQNEGFLWLAEELKALQGLCPVQLVIVSLNPKLQGAAPNCWDLEGSDRVPVSGHTEKLWRERMTETDTKFQPCYLLLPAVWTLDLSNTTVTYRKKNCKRKLKPVWERAVERQLQHPQTACR